MKSFYKCDTHFHLDNILDMYDSETNYGIVLISGKEFRCYSVNLSGSHVEFKKLVKITEELQKKQGRGGSSAARIDRIRQSKQDHYVKRMAELILGTYTCNNHCKYTVERLIVAGPSTIKREVLDEKIITQYFSKKIMKVLDITEIDDSSVLKVYNKCSELFMTKEDKHSVQVLSTIKDLIIKNSDLLAFGQNEIIEGLENHTLKSILISSSLPNDIRTKLDELNTYGCEIYDIDESYLKGYGNFIGVKWFV